MPQNDRLAERTPVALRISTTYPPVIVSLASHEIRQVPFPAGSVLFLYSDALTESKDAMGERMGNQGLIERVTRHLRVGSPEDLLIVVVGDFVRSLEYGLPDDLTAVSVWRRS